MSIWIRYYFTVFSLLAVSGIALGQRTEIRGTVTDTTLQPLSSATIMLLNAEDSILVSFAVSDPEGAFLIKQVKPNDYLLQVSYLGFQTHFQEISITDADPVDVGAINMQHEGALLSEVEITAEHVPIQIKKDTIEYNAEAFKGQPNDAVEDLLKKLPGMEVESDGTVKAQGETVEKVLVDGKEFFGTDPKIATKNLPADAVDKVQVFDKLSDMAEFSGIDDGDRTKTINLALKEDHKKGVFGNISAGYGSDDRYETKTNINRFTESSQLSFIGMANNVNQQGFSIQDYVNFSGGMQNIMRGGGRSRGGGSGIQINSGISDGFVKTLAGGLNYNVDFGKKTELRMSYFHNGIKNDIKQDVFRYRMKQVRVPIIV
jgi:hypothetical protein